jgi:DsbC/DsbD-like thiol-disulfide interchange protein
MRENRTLKERIQAAASVILVLSACAMAGASIQIPQEPVKWTIKAALPDRPLKPGEPFTVQLTATIENRWHLYATEQAEGGPTPTRIFLPGDQPFEQAGSIEAEEPKTELDPNFNLMTGYYEEQAVFTLPVKVAAKASPGKSELRISASFQTCSDELCLPPKTVKLAVAVNIAR